MTTTVSTAVSNLTAATKAVTSRGLIGSPMLVIMDTVTVPDTENADIVLLAPLPVDAKIISFDLNVADLGSAATVDIGLYKRTTAGDTTDFAVVDADCIAANLDLTQPIAMGLAPTRFAGLAADSVGTPLWEIAGLLSKPTYSHFFLGLTTDVGTTAAGKASVLITYTA